MKIKLFATAAAALAAGAAVSGASAQSTLHHSLKRKPGAKRTPGISSITCLP